MPDTWLPTPPTWFTLDAQTVIEDGILIDEQFSENEVVDDLPSQVERSIKEWASVNLNRIRRKALTLGLISNLSDDLATLLNIEQKSQFASATKLFVISDFQSRARNEDHQAVAKAKADGRGEAIIGGVRATSGEALLLGLEADLDAMARAAQGGGASSVAVGRERCGCDETEYGGRGWFREY